MNELCQTIAIFDKNWPVFDKMKENDIFVVKLV